MLLFGVDGALLWDYANANMLVAFRRGVVDLDTGFLDFGTGIWVAEVTKGCAAARTIFTTDEDTRVGAHQPRVANIDELAGFTVDAVALA